MAASAPPSLPEAAACLRFFFFRPSYGPHASDAPSSESASAEKPASSSSSSSLSCWAAARAAFRRGGLASEVSLPSSEKSAESPSALARKQSSSSW